MMRLRDARRAICADYYSETPFFDLSAQVKDTEWIVIIYYAASIYISAGFIGQINRIVQVTNSWDFLWPLVWVEGLNIPLVLELLSIACFLSSLLALQFRRHLAARGLFSFVFLLAATVTNSLGGINHPYHAWFWVSLVLLFLPNGNPEKFGRASKLSYCTVILAAQALFLLFYSMSGAWKILIGLIDLSNGQPGNFSPGALSWTLANRILQTGTDPILANLFIHNLWLAWPLFIATMYFQLVSVVVAFRPRLHVLWGYLLISFHLGTWLLMEIIFTQHVLLLIILLVLSPQRRAFGSLGGALRDLPFLGPVFGHFVSGDAKTVCARSTT